MERNEGNEYFQNDSINDNVYTNSKNILLIILILIFAILIERSFPNSILKNIYFILTIIIIIFFILYNFSQDNSKIKLFIQSIPFFSSKQEIIRNREKEKMDKIKNVYKIGYFNNKKNSYINDYNEQKQYINQSKNYYDKNLYNRTKNDEYLANKISNINKINNTTLMDSFKKTNKPINYDYDNNNYNNQNINYYDINNNNKLTRLPDSSSYKYESNSKRDYLGNKNSVANPFNNKINNQNSKDSSGNYYLFSANRNKMQYNIINNNQYNKNQISINRFNAIETIPSTNNIFESIINKIPKNKEVSYNNYQLLKKQYENTQSLEQNNNNLIDYNKFINKFPKELINFNNNWILKMKIFISKNLIPNLITKHDNNINYLNTLLSSLGLKIISTLPDYGNNDYLNVLNKKLSILNSNQINDYKESNILLQKLRNNLGNNMNNYYINNYKDDNENNNKYFSSLNNFSSFLNESREINDINNNDNKLKKIFFGDTNKIKEILRLVENKINEIKVKNNNEYKINSNYQKQMIIKVINSNNNPFFKKEDTRTLDDYIKNSNDNNTSLTNLQRLLYERIIINERLYPKELFYTKNEIHALLVIEYAMERYKQLNQNFDMYGNGSRGGEFLNEAWCSLLPTDSQLIAHLVMNYIESIYLINHGINEQKFLLSFPSNYIISSKENLINEKNNRTSIFLYQINPINVEPVFNVVYENILIPSFSRNMNLFEALCIYFYLLSIKSPMFVMNLGIHNFIDNITK